MALTIHRYRYNDEYLIDSSENKVRIDFMKANTFHAEMIEQRGDNDMGNIILHFFETDDEYGTRLGVKEGIMSALALKQEDLDFLLLTENENGIDSDHFYKSEFTNMFLKK